MHWGEELVYSVNTWHVDMHISSYHPLSDSVVEFGAQLEWNLRHLHYTGKLLTVCVLHILFIYVYIDFSCVFYFELLSYFPFIGGETYPSPFSRWCTGPPLFYAQVWVWGWRTYPEPFAICTKVWIHASIRARLPKQPSTNTELLKMVQQNRRA